MFKGLYSCDLWIDGDDAEALGTAGLTTLRAYELLASLCYEQGEAWFPLMARLHSIDHQCRDLINQSQAFGYSWNPLGDSVQMDEDLVGHVSRFHRACDSRQQSLRSLERYLVATDQVWREVCESTLLQQ
jgi:hypothetical protein